MTFSKWRFLAVALTVGCAAPPVATTVSAQTYQCADSTNDEAYQLETYIVQIVTGTDSLSTQARAQYQLPTATASKVSYVSSTTTCRTAAQNYFTTLGKPAPTSGTVLVTLVKISPTNYAVSVIGERAGEFAVTMTFDSKWRHLATVID